MNKFKIFNKKSKPRNVETDTEISIPVRDLKTHMVNEFDNVLNPSYYADRKIEVFDFISDTLRNNSSFTPEDGYQYGSITKYTARAGMKIIGNATLQEAKLQDLKKARRHLDEWIKSLELNTKEKV